MKASKMLLIKNVNLIDGLNNPVYKSDILVVGDKIVKTGNIDIDASGVEIIDGEGLYAAPGFIDSHSHSDMSCAFEAYADGKLRQGVTTEVSGMCGMSPAPIKNFREEFYGVSFGNRPECTKIADGWSSFSDFKSYVNSKGLPVDMATLVGHGTLRAAIVGYADRAVTTYELEQMKALLEEALQNGAIGLSSGLIYPPGVYANTYELIELCKVVAQYGGIYVSHIRNEADFLIEAVNEAIEIGEKSGCKVQISHHKAAGKKNHGKVIKTLNLMEAARRRGVIISCDAYPYTAGSSSLVTLLPPWAHEGGKEKILERLKDAETRAIMREEVGSPDTPWENMGMNAGWAGILICNLGKNKQYEGLNIEELGQEVGKHPIDALFDLLIDENGNGQMACFAAKDEDNHYVYKHRLTVVGSDSSNDYFEVGENSGKPHPRTFGTFPRVIGHYSRELKLFPVETAVYKMTGLAAGIYNLEDRGVLAEGLLADIVIFDYDTIIDKATYKNPHQPPEGIKYVIKSGEIVVKDDVYNQSLLGKML